MKNLISISLLLISFAVNAQIKVVESDKPSTTIGKIGSMGSVWVELTKKDEVYVISYQDTQYTQLDVYKAVAFENIDNAVDTLYKTIMDGFVSVPKEDIKIELPTTILYLHYTKNMGIVSVQFMSANKDGSQMGTSVWMTKKQINKVFAKT